jgi:drug/metabolite transporter superfamily protein YnfA
MLKWIVETNCTQSRSTHIRRSAAKAPTAHAGIRPSRPAARLLQLRCSTVQPAKQPATVPQPSPPPPPALLLLRRCLLVAVVAKVCLFTPEIPLVNSALLGALGSVLSSRDAVLGGVLASKDALLRMLNGLGPHAKPAVSVALYLLAGVCEIGGGWLVWQALRSSRPWWWALLGSAVLVAYGFVAALQPIEQFGRAFALYGGYFVVMSLGWGAVFDGFRPDRGDLAGCALIVAGIVLMSAWPRSR